MQYAALASLIRRFAADRNATTAIEYAIIASSVAVAIVGAVVALGSERVTACSRKSSTPIRADALL